MTVQNCSEYCMNWDERKHCCSLGHRTFRSKKNPNSFFAPDCKDYMDIDTYMESEGVSNNNYESSWTDNENERRTARNMRSQERKAPIYYDESERRSSRGVLSEKRQNLDDEYLIENLVNENHTISKLINEFVNSENINLDDQQNEENDELSEFIDESIEVEDGYTDVPEEISQLRANINQRVSRSDRPKTMGNIPINKQEDVEEFSSVDDFVDESFGIIDSYGSSIEAAREGIPEIENTESTDSESLEIKEVPQVEQLNEAPEKQD